MAYVKQETGRGFASNGITTAAVSNTTTETVLFSTVVPAGALGTQKRVDFYVSCNITTAAVAPGITITVKFGGATIAVMNSVTLLALQTNKPFLIEGRMKNTSANTQEIYVKISKNTSGLIVGADMNSASWTVDTTVDQTFQITTQFASALSGTTLTVKDADMECS